MHVAVLGASSQIAKDWLRLVLPPRKFETSLFARDPANLDDWLHSNELPSPRWIASYEEFGLAENFDAILNFVGSGDPIKISSMGREILDVTRTYDELAMEYVRGRPSTKYIFMSSGAVYGHVFSSDGRNRTFASFPIDAIESSDFYGFSKLTAEINHRSHPDLNITDIRIYSYASRYMSPNGAFLVSVIARAIVDRTVLRTNDRDIARDYVGGDDFARLISTCLIEQTGNEAVDCYSAAPTTKMAILRMAAERYGLEYEVHAADTPIGSDFKAAYYPRDRKASEYGYAPLYSSDQVVEDALDGMVQTHRATAGVTK